MWLIRLFAWAGFIGAIIRGPFLLFLFALGVLIAIEVAIRELEKNAANWDYPRILLKRANDERAKSKEASDKSSVDVPQVTPAREAGAHATQQISRSASSLDADKLDSERVSEVATHFIENRAGTWLSIGWEFNVHETTVKLFRHHGYSLREIRAGLVLAGSRLDEMIRRVVGPEQEWEVPTQGVSGNRQGIQFGVVEFDALVVTFGYEPERARRDIATMDKAKEFVESFAPWNLFTQDADVSVEAAVRPLDG